MIYLQTNRLIIRDYILDDLNDYYALYSNIKVVYYFPEGYHETIYKAKKQLDVAMDEAKKANRQKYYFSIRSRENNSFIGEVGYSIIENTPIGKLVGIGYFLLPEYWQNGYATEALREVIRFAFENENVFRIKAGCVKENVSSEKVMIKCGMVKEGDFKSSTWHDGQIKDSVSYRLLKSEWKKQE